MPNHIQNRLQIIGDDSEVQKVFAHIEGKYDDGGKMQIDFNKIIPMPKELDFHRLDGWMKYSWGTNWNAYSQNDKRNTRDTIYFETAWAAPFKVIQQLSKMFPLVKLVFAYADEDSGFNTGKLVFEKGAPTEISQPEGQSPEDKDYYQLVGDKYHYIEDGE